MRKHWTVTVGTARQVRAGSAGECEPFGRGARLAWGSESCARPRVLRVETVSVWSGYLSRGKCRSRRRYPGRTSRGRWDGPQISRHRVRFKESLRVRRGGWRVWLLLLLLSNDGGGGGRFCPPRGSHALIASPRAGEGLVSSRAIAPAVVFSPKLTSRTIVSQRKKSKEKITLSGGSLGSCVDEERSQLRELM